MCPLCSKNSYSKSRQLTKKLRPSQPAQQLGVPLPGGHELAVTEDPAVAVDGGRMVCPAVGLHTAIDRSG